MTNRRPIEALFEPRSIAVVGASRDPAKIGHTVLKNLLNGAYDGKVYPVNPHAEKVLDRVCHPTMGSIGTPVDVAVIAVPGPMVEEVVADALRAPVKALIIISAGFRESGSEGAAREDALAVRCRKAGVLLLGPNGYGVINTQGHLNASFARALPRPGGLAMLSQSGALCTAFLDWAMGAGVGVSKVIGVGNQAGINEVEMLRYLGEDPETRAIACYIESIANGDAFVQALETVSEFKPVVILRAGVSAAGRRAVITHSGRTPGADVAYGAAFKRAGVIRAESFEVLRDMAMVLATQPLTTGPRVAILSNAGGPGVVAADAAIRLALEVPDLASEAARRLAGILPPGASIGNPTDLRGEATPERLADALKAVEATPEMDSTVLVITPHGMLQLEAAADAIAATQPTRPLVTAIMGGSEAELARKKLCMRDMAALPTPERAIQALRALYEYSAWRSRPPRVITRFPVNRHRVERILRRNIRAGRRALSEIDAKAILSAYDFAVPQGMFARGADEAVEAATRMGFPVAMKIVSPQIVRKTDIGGVQLDLSASSQVRDAYELMLARIAVKIPDAQLEGVYVETMCGEGREVILGMRRDPQFGPMLLFGIGGIFMETMDDVNFYLAPITETEALQMLEQTRTYQFVRELRGDTPLDTLAVARGLQRISQLATDFPVIEELDIAPLIVRACGEEPLVADARMVLQKGEAP